MEDISILLDIIACYFVSTYYTTLYNMAVDDTKSGKYRSLDVSYTYRIDMYMLSFKTSDKTQFSKILTNLHQYHNSIVKKPATMDEWINSIIVHCIPPQFYNQMSKVDSKKYGYMRAYLREVIIDFTAFVKENSTKVYNRSKAHGDYFRDKLVELLVDHKNKMYSKFISNKTDDHYTTHLKRSIGELISKNHDLLIKHNQLCAFIKKLKDIIHIQEERIRDLENPKIVEVTGQAVASEVTSGPTKTISDEPSSVKADYTNAEKEFMSEDVSDKADDKSLSASSPIESTEPDELEKISEETDDL